MTAQLNHTIVWCRDNRASSAFLTNILRLPPAESVLHFMVVQLGNGVALDFMAKDGDVAPQHYAFLVSDDDFDFGLDQIRKAGQPYWADPGRGRSGEIYERHGGRGFYFNDPDGHLLELLTQA
ncbi:MAG: VOC family protein [Sphingomonas sp.]|jgi:catechol 2,3-dioxygenase-like lactoylglutathione lyase family enzyme|uniref:VOC family protein n=1 Tax=Sphingomonas sp. TaxID=28214 RepID=UPI00356465DA